MGYAKLFSLAVLAAIAAMPVSSAAAPKQPPSAASQLLDAIEKDCRGQKPNLRKYDEFKARYLQAIAISSNAYDLARAKILYAKYEKACAMNGTSGQWVQAQVDAFRADGLSSTNRIRLMRSCQMDGIDLETDGWDVVKDDPGLYREYFDMLRHAYRGGPKELDERTSYEHRIELFEKAVELVPGTDGQNFVFDLADALRRTGRYEEGEQVLLPWTTNENKYVRAKAFSDLSRYYSDAASRYYSDPNRDLLLKALDAADGMLEARRLFDLRRDDLRGAIDLCFKLKDYERAGKYIGEYLQVCEKRGQKPDGYIAAKSGDRWYFLGDYEEAVKAYSSVENLPSERSPENALTRYAGALYALGRYAECLAVVEKLHSAGDLRERNLLYKRVLEEKLQQ